MKSDTVTVATLTGSRVLIRDGVTYQIRPLGRDDRALLVACFEALSPASRRLRFFSAKQALSAADLDHLTQVDGEDHLAYAVLRLDQAGRECEILGVARCIRLGPGADTAELAIGVVDHAQGRGLGSALLDQLIEAAHARAIRRLRFEVLADNEAMRALAQRLGGRARWLDDGVLEYDCLLPEPEQVAVAAPPTGVRPPLLTDVLTGAWERALRSATGLYETLVWGWYHTWTLQPPEDEVHVAHPRI